MFVVYWYDESYHVLDYSRYIEEKCDTYDKAVQVLISHKRGYVTDSEGHVVCMPWEDPDNFFDED